MGVWTDGQTAGHLGDSGAGHECSHVLPGLVKAVLPCVPFLCLPSMAEYFWAYVEGPHLHGSNHPMIKQFSQA